MANDGADIGSASPTDLPEGWASVGLGQVAELASGAGFPLEHQNLRGLEYPFFKVGNLAEVEPGIALATSNHTIDGELVEKLKARVMPPGSVVFAKIGMAIRLNRRRRLAVPACIDNNMMAAIPGPAIASAYLLRFLETVDLMPLTQATTVPSLRKSELEAIALRLPPLPEQRRIVAKVEELLAQVNAARERLAKVPALLKRFRQSVLAAACSGRLTEGWRAAQAPSEQWNPPRERDEQASKRPRLRPAETPDALPVGWRWLSVDELLIHGRSVGYGFVKPGPHDPEGVRVLKSGAVNYGRVDLSDTFRISAALDAQYRRTRLVGGEVLLNLVGASIGRSAVAPPEAAGWNVSRAIAVIPVWPDLARWVHISLDGPAGQKIMQAKSGGSAQPVLNLEEVRALGIGVPPSAECAEIQRRVDGLLRLADSVEEHVAAATARADKLTQAILAKAFRGELVPTEAELARKEGRAFESAAEMLARVSAQQIERPSARKARRSSTPKRARA